MKWARALGYLPINYDERIAVVEDMTQRVSFCGNLNGNQVRLHFSNRYGKKPLFLNRVTIMPEEETSLAGIVTLHGEEKICLEPGEECYSDILSFPVKAGQCLRVCIYVQDRQEIGSICAFWSLSGTKVEFCKGDGCESLLGEQTNPQDLLPFIRDDPNPYRTIFFYGFDGVDILTEDSVRTIAAFGDSITHMSFMTNALGKRLRKEFPGRVTLINCGIGGNRLVHDASFVRTAGKVAPCFGDAGVKRFERDVFGAGDVDAVLAFIGINDIMQPIQLEGGSEPTPAEDIIEGYKTIIRIAHEHGARIYGGTLMPCGNPDFPDWWLPAFEKVRRPLNEWVKEKAEYDGIFDFEAVMKDDTRPGYLLPGVHIGDGLHPNDVGGRIMAEAVRLGELTGLATPDGEGV